MSLPVQFYIFMRIYKWLSFLFSSVPFSIDFLVILGKYDFVYFLLSSSKQRNSKLFGGIFILINIWEFLSYQISQAMDYKFSFTILKYCFFLWFRLLISVSLDLSATWNLSSFAYHWRNPVFRVTLMSVSSRSSWTVTSFCCFIKSVHFGTQSWHGLSNGQETKLNLKH